MYHRALKLIRLYNNLSQIEVAERLRLSKSYLSEIEKGTKKPSTDVLERYAEEFELPLSQLLIFSEATNDRMRERARVFAVDKVLRMLEWVEKETENKAA